MKQKDLIIIKNIALSVLIIIFYSVISVSYDHITCFTDTDRIPDFLFLLAIAIYFYLKTFLEIKHLTK